MLGVACSPSRRAIQDCSQSVLKAKPVESSINLGAPNRPGIFAYMIRDVDLVVFTQFLPLRDRRGLRSCIHCRASGLLRSIVRDSSPAHL
jgi:hypothetical protein